MGSLEYSEIPINIFFIILFIKILELHPLTNNNYEHIILYGK